MADAPVAGTDPRSAADPFLNAVAQHGFHLSAGKQTEINGMPAYVATARIDRGRARVILESAWVQRQGLIFRFFGMTSTSPAHDRSAGIRQALKTFRTLTTDERSSFTVDRLRIVMAEDGETLVDLSQRVGNQWAQEALAVMNRIAPTTPLSAGQPVKVSMAERYVPRPWQR